jgi:surface antigen
MNARRHSREIARWNVLLLAGVFAFLAGCAGDGNKADFGAFLGAASGALIGRQVDDGAGGILLGAVLGGFFGYQIGKYMDEKDKARLAKSLQETPTGETDSWTNARSGKHFEVTPTSDTYAEAGKACRKFTQVVVVNGEETEVPGTACKAPSEPDWSVV